MDFRDERLISAPPQKVWEYLLDPEILKECVPGCENFTGNITDGFEAIIVQKIGPVKAKFKGLIFLSDLDAPNSVRISGNGDGGIAGFAKGGADVTLAPDGNGTKLSYDVQAQIGGKLAQLGSRIIDSFVSQMADQFFEIFQAKVEGRSQNLTKKVQPNIGFWQKVLRFFKR
ncbi:MAG: carbon monoxide dehydrogenase subunit G [Planktomarina sp.]|nr:carbon monoxide dehydrogenase subunit G [Planktomarina sp.]MDT2050317.1 carbon monoxide dehydrogenase subunit G [Planktomarina sp.]